MSISTDDKEYISGKLGSNLLLLKNSNLFITGATGFFGKWIIETLLYLNKELDLNIHICALSRDPETFLHQFSDFSLIKSLTWMKGDIKSFEYPTGSYDYIIHAATDADAKLNAENPLLMIDTITAGTRRVLEFAKNQSNLKSLLFTSSGAVYGKQPSGSSYINESDTFNIELNNPATAYDEGKRLAEVYCSIYLRQFNVPVVIARCFAFVGPYLPLNKHYAIGNFINDGLNGHNITITGDGKTKRSYMYAADLVVWLLTLLLKGKKGEAYNVGSGHAISIAELAEKIAGIFPGITYNILNQNLATDRNPNYIPDVSKFMNEFKIDQYIELDNAILRTVAYYKNLENDKGI